jgi:hypothetical protein
MNVKHVYRFTREEVEGILREHMREHFPSHFSGRVDRVELRECLRVKAGCTLVTEYDGHEIAIVEQELP